MCGKFYIEAVTEKGVGFFFQAEDGIRDYKVTGVQTCALPISTPRRIARSVDGTAASIHARRVSDECRARGRDRSQAQTGFWLSASKPRENRREHKLLGLDAVH